MTNTRISDRRQSTDRRQSGDRRLKADARHAMIELCPSLLHMALVIRGSANGEDKVITRSVRWRKEATSLHTERGRLELTEAFRALVSEERLAGAKVRIALGGEFCVTRVIAGATDDVRREFNELEERSLRYLTLGTGPKALSGNFQQLDARHQYALLAVANQKTLDLLMQIAEGAGVHLESIEPSLIALSRAQSNLRNKCEEACLIVQLDEGGAELGICHHGRLLLDYRPGGHIKAENVADVVSQHLSRLQRYLHRYHSYLDAPLRDVYLTGDADAVGGAQRAFALLRQFQVHILEPAELNIDWKYTSDTAPGTDMVAALGTAISLYQSAGDQEGPNLIEQALAELREPMRPILIRSLAPIAALLLVAVGLLAVLVNEKRGVADLRAELEGLNPSRMRASELTHTLGAAEAKLSQLRQLADRLPLPEWQQILQRIGQCMPDDVWLDRLTVHDGRSAALTGASYTDGGVYDFVGNLKQVPDIAQIALEGTGVGHSATGPTTNFDLQITLADPAGRNGNEGHHD